MSQQYTQNQPNFVINSQPGTEQRITGPGVYNYGGNYNSGIYDSNTYPEQRVTYAENVHARSQVGQDYNDKRFAGYTRKVREDLDYKYNVFSLVDEPWNRCCVAGKCGSFPGNEGIAKDHTFAKWH